jgi:very-short-patch-repair endonuclease
MDAYELSQLAKRLRQNPTPYEVLFRYKLQEWKIRFKFQKILCGYVADFYLPEYECIVEIDGSGHYTEWGLLKDKLRDAELRHAGYSVLHIRNPEVADYRKEDLLTFCEGLLEIPHDRSFHSQYLQSLQ